MLKPRALSQAEKDKHYDFVRNRFRTQLTASVAKLGGGTYDDKLMARLETELKTLAVGSPVELEALAIDIIAKFPAFSGYAALRDREKHPNHAAHKNTLSVVQACFDYGWFSSQRKTWGAYHLVEAYGLRICPYCQASHVNFHIEKAAKKSGGVEFEMRPPLDHYLPKSIYPYLAVSLSNLVPSCVQCNSGVKTANDPLGKGRAHPLGATKISVQFSAKGTPPKVLNGKLDTDDIVLTLSAADRESNYHMIDFRLQERYQWYRHEVKDLLDRHYEHDELHTSLREFIPRELYVLGFLEKHAEDRAIGLCMRDIFRELKP